MSKKTTKKEEPEMTNLQELPKTRLIPVTKWPLYHPYPSVPALRNLIFFEKTNNFSRVIRRVGRRVLISEADFFQWIEEQQEKRR